jgi:hypothetical protein
VRLETFPFWTLQSLIIPLSWPTTRPFSLAGADCLREKEKEYDDALWTHSLAGLERKNKPSATGSQVLAP